MSGLGMNSVDYYNYMEFELAYPLVTAAAHAATQAAVADTLPVDDVEFLLSWGENVPFAYVHCGGTS